MRKSADPDWQGLAVGGAVSRPLRRSRTDGPQTSAGTRSCSRIEEAVQLQRRE